MNCTGKRCLMQHGKVDPATCQCISYCPQATPPKTNADRIRSMSDKDLAYWYFNEFFCKTPYCRKEECYEDTPCEECLLEWLKEEVKDD